MPDEQDTGTIPAAVDEPATATTEADAPAASETAEASETPETGTEPSEPEPTLTSEPEADESTVESDETAEASEAAPVEAGPRTVGRFIADALRAAGVRYAFTVPGESFLGLLEGLQAAGIRVVATRHEGAASFM